MKEWLWRALRTFLQSAVGYLCVAVPTIDWTEDVSVLKTALVGLGVSAVAAGLSAAMNLGEGD